MAGAKPLAGRRSSGPSLRSEAVANVGQRPSGCPCIGKGARWSSDIAGALDTIKAGVLCVTPDNQDSLDVMEMLGQRTELMGRRYAHATELPNRESREGWPNASMRKLETKSRRRSELHGGKTRVRRTQHGARRCEGETSGTKARSLSAPGRRLAKSRARHAKLEWRPHR